MIGPPPKVTLRITKELGAARQVEAAIDAFLRGDFDVCITLAGAAEGMFSHRKGSDLHTIMMDDPRAQQFGSKELNAGINAERDWLKHTNPAHPAEIEITPFEAAHMLIRAMTKLDRWTAKMDQIKPVIYAVVVGDKSADGAREH